MIGPLTKSFPVIEWRSHAPSGREKYEWVFNGEKVIIFLLPMITHMLFVDLNSNFSCQEFDRLLCNV